jgi:hypothetical protein
LAIRYNSKGERRLVPTKSRRGDAALIRTRGAAKAVWIAVAWRLRQGGKPSGDAGKAGVTYSAVSQVEKGESSFVQISTNLRYMKKLDTTNNIIGGAIGAAGRALDRELKNLGQAWTRRWGS